MYKRFIGLNAIKITEAYRMICPLALMTKNSYLFVRYVCVRFSITFVFNGRVLLFQ